MMAMTIAPSATAQDGTPTQVWESSGDPSRPLVHPGALDIDPDGNLWVLDGPADSFQLLDADGTFLEAWGRAGTGPGEFDFTRPQALRRPMWNADHPDGPTWQQIDIEYGGDIAFVSDGSFYVVDPGNQRVQRFDADREFLGEWGGFGKDDGHFVSPVSVAVDADGRVFVSDDGRDDVQVFESDGTHLWTFGRLGSGDGDFADLGYLTVHDADGNVDVGDVPNGRFQTCVGSNREGGLPTRWICLGGPMSFGGLSPEPFGFAAPQDLAYGSDGRLYVADFGFSRISIRDLLQHTVMVTGALGEGPGQFRGITGIAVDDAGDIYTSEYLGGRVQKLAAVSAAS